jgi:hypothetical protein
MKDMTKEEINDGRPVDDALWLVNFCLDALYDDKVHNFTDAINSRLTFEELLGTLLKAKDSLESYERFYNELGEES